MSIEIVVFHWRWWLSFLGIVDPPADNAFLISKVRVLLLIGAFLLWRLFRPKSFVWSVELDEMSRRGRIALVVAGVAVSLFVAWFSSLSGQAEWLDNPSYNDGIEAIQDGNQYDYLADALLSGQLSLDLPVPSFLAEMDNPYDTAAREAINSTLKDTVYWDYAYYEGAYYCYFGVIPCLLTFLPFKAITGMDLRTDVAVVLFAWFAMVTGGALLFALKKAYFPRLSLGSFLVGFVVLVLSCGIFEQVFLPRIYPIPILSALAFEMLGLTLWISARSRFRESGKWSYPLLALGSTSIALTLGCRPQFVLGALLAFPIFAREIRRREFFSLRGLSTTMAVILPFLPIAAGVGTYNYLRFGSFTDFGATYNLTGADMTSYTFELDKIILQVYEYLLLPFQGMSEFPFISTVNESGLIDIDLNYWTTEPFYAGFLFLNPVSFIMLGLFFKRVRNALPDDELIPLFITCDALALFIIVLVSFVSGTNMRYFADFAWLILLPVVLVCWSLIEQRGPAIEEKPSHLRRADCMGAQHKHIGTTLAVVSLLGLVLYGWTFLGTSRFGALCTQSPWIYEAVSNAILSLT